jgi:hypothetical protein
VLQRFTGVLQGCYLVFGLEVSYEVVENKFVEVPMSKDMLIQGGVSNIYLQSMGEQHLCVCVTRDYKNVAKVLQGYYTRVTLHPRSAPSTMQAPSPIFSMYIRLTVCMRISVFIRVVCTMVSLCIRISMCMRISVKRVFTSPSTILATHTCVLVRPTSTNITCCGSLSCAIGVLQECYKSVTRVLQECYKSVTRVFQECYKSVTRVLQECYKTVTRVLQECYKSVKGVLQECYKSVTRVLQGCYKGVTRVLQECYKSVTRML